MRKILLLGGNGYVGSRLHDHLSSAGHQVTNVDLCWFGKTHEDTIVADYSTLNKEFISEYTHVILLAAHSSVSMCAGSMVPCFQNNVMKFVELIEKVNHEQTLIYASTAAVYGNNDALVDESYPLARGISYYDYTKICNDNIAHLYPNKKIIGLRFGSVGGFSKNFRRENLMNAVTMSALNSGKITVTNPQNYRSVLGMEDLCRSISRILLNDSHKSRIYNITSVNTRIIDFAQEIRAISNCDIAVNDAQTTSYSFNCSNLLFEKDYDFKFQDTVKSIYFDIADNADKIVSDMKREPRVIQ